MYRFPVHSPLHCRAALTGRRGLTHITWFGVFTTMWFGELGARPICRSNVGRCYAFPLFLEFCASWESRICGSSIVALFDDAVFWETATKTRRPRFSWRCMVAIPLKYYKMRRRTKKKSMTFVNHFPKGLFVLRLRYQCRSRWGCVDEWRRDRSYLPAIFIWSLFCICWW